MNTLLLNHIGDAVVALDPQFQVVFANQKAVDFFGCADTSDLLGSNLTERISSEPQQFFSAILNGCDRVISPQPVMFQHEDGCQVLADLSCAEIEYNDLRLFVITLHDYALAQIISADDQTLKEGFFRACSPIALADDSGTIIVANNAFKNAFQLPKHAGNIEVMFSGFGSGWREKLDANGTFRTQEEIGQNTYLIQVERLEKQRLMIMCTRLFPTEENPVRVSMPEMDYVNRKNTTEPEDLGTIALVTDSIMLKNFIIKQLENAGVKHEAFSSKQFSEIKKSKPGESSYIIYAQPLIDDLEMRDIWRIIDEHPDSRLLALSFTFEEGRDLEVIQSGARGLINSEEHFTHLVAALYAIHNGEYWCPRSILERFLRLNRNAFNMGRPGAKQQFGLTRREIEVVKLLAQNKSNKEIAEALGIAYTTIVTHVYNIFRKLDVHSRYEAIQVSIRNSIV